MLDACTVHDEATAVRVKIAMRSPEQGKTDGVDDLDRS